MATSIYMLKYTHNNSDIHTLTEVYNIGAGSQYLKVRIPTKLSNI